MRALEILADTSVKGVPVSPGDIVEVDEADARILMGYGLARPVEPTEKAEIQKKEILLELSETEKAMTKPKKQKGDK